MFKVVLATAMESRFGKNKWRLIALVGVMTFVTMITLWLEVKLDKASPEIYLDSAIHQINIVSTNTLMAVRSSVHTTFL